MSVQFTSITKESGSQSIVFLAGGELLPAVDDSHANFAKLREAAARILAGETVEADEVIDLINVTKAVQRAFRDLSDRVSVSDGQVYLDGDAVDGALQDQILDFLNSGEDFKPLVAFYEKLATNPLGNVQQGIFDWIKGQTDGGGKVTIAPDGDLIGYKSCRRVEQGDRVVFVPSQVSRHGGDRVNGVEVQPGSYIEQQPGDTVEMPRSKVLNAPSRACGDGLHIGTWAYASTFYGGDTVLLVKFNPRDVVSLPDSNSTWKLRVSRYKVLGVVTEPLETPLYLLNGDDDTREAFAEAGFDEDDLGFDDADFILS